MNPSSSKYYNLPICDGLEALVVRQYNTSFPFHFHPTYNISLIFEGTFSSQLTDRSLFAPLGTMLITNPGEIHANPCDKLDHVSFFTFYISQEFVNYCNDGQPVHFDQKTINDNQLFGELYQLAVLIRENDLIGSFEQKLKETLGLLAHRYGSVRPGPKDHEFRSLFEELLTGEPPEKFSLEAAANRFGIDKYKFIRLFKFQTGLTPNNYFILKRIEKSKLLLKSGQDVFSTAIDLGFYDAAHYSNHFKRFTGISPAAYIAGS